MKDIIGGSMNKRYADLLSFLQRTERETMEQLNRLSARTGRSRTDIVNDAIDKEIVNLIQQTKERLRAKPRTLESGITDIFHSGSKFTLFFAIEGLVCTVEKAISKF
mgnify:CR=1 FL=1